jgi:hypothetical protein
VISTDLLPGKLPPAISTGVKRRNILSSYFEKLPNLHYGYLSHHDLLHHAYCIKAESQIPIIKKLVTQFSTILI